MKDARQFYIDGKWVAPSMPHDSAVINPATEEQIATISLGSAADVDKAVPAAKRAFDSFSETTVEQRRELLQRIVSVYKAKSQEMALAISSEMGAPLAPREAPPGGRPTRALLGVFRRSRTLPVGRGARKTPFPQGTHGLWRIDH